MSMTDAPAGPTVEPLLLVADAPVNVTVSNFAKATSEPSESKSPTIYSWAVRSEDRLVGSKPSDHWTCL